MTGDPLPSLAFHLPFYTSLCLPSVALHRERVTLKFHCNFDASIVSAVSRGFHVCKRLTKRLRNSPNLSGQRPVVSCASGAVSLEWPAQRQSHRTRHDA